MLGQSTRYKEHPNARCFDPCNRGLSFRESRRTPISHFWECEFHPHTYPKVGLQQGWSPSPCWNTNIVRYLSGTCQARSRYLPSSNPMRSPNSHLARDSVGWEIPPTHTCKRRGRRRISYALDKFTDVTSCFNILACSVVVKLITANHILNKFTYATSCFTIQSIIFLYICLSSLPSSFGC